MWHLLWLEVLDTFVHGFDALAGSGAEHFLLGLGEVGEIGSGELEEAVGFLVGRHALFRFLSARWDRDTNIRCWRARGKEFPQIHPDFVGIHLRALKARGGPAGEPGERVDHVRHER